MPRPKSFLKWLVQRQLRLRPLVLSLRQKKQRIKQTHGRNIKQHHPRNQQEHKKEKSSTFKYNRNRNRSWEYHQHWIFQDAGLVKLCQPKPPYYPKVGAFHAWSKPFPKQVLEEIILKHINCDVLISNLNDVYFICANRNNSDYWCREGELTWQSIKPGYDKGNEVQKIIGFAMVSLERVLDKSILWVDLCEVMPYWRGHNFNQLLLEKVHDSIGRVEPIDAMLPRNPEPNLGYWIHNSNWIATTLDWAQEERCCEEEQDGKKSAIDRIFTTSSDDDNDNKVCQDCESGNFQACWIRKLAKHGKWDDRLSQSVLKALS